MKADEKSVVGYFIIIFAGFGAFTIYHGFLSLYKYEYKGNQGKLRINYTIALFATGLIVLLISSYLFIKVFDRRLL